MSIIKTSIPENTKNDVLDDLSKINREFSQIYPGIRGERQPIHTVYGGADLFSFDIAQKLGKRATASLTTYAADFTEFGHAFQLRDHIDLPSKQEDISGRSQILDSMSQSERLSEKDGLIYSVFEKVKQKLSKEPVEDFRIDFEDGFGNRSWAEEDEVAQNAAEECAKGLKVNSLPPFIGIRIKPFTEDHKERGIRTLDIFLTTLLNETQGQLPNNFVVMLPKVTSPGQITSLARLMSIFEDIHSMQDKSLKLEIMVETTQAIMNESGVNPLMSFFKAARGRMISTAFGTYDYTASNEITAQFQDMGHGVCDHAHYIMKTALGDTGIWLSDGATNIMPIGPYKGSNLSPSQLRENRESVHENWRRAFNHIQHSLWKGLYQGWDLHPSQLPARYAAVYSFFMESQVEAGLRLKAFLDTAARATLTGSIFDDAATGQGLLNFYLRGLNCGALSLEDLSDLGLTSEEIQSRSFYHILQNRKGKNQHEGGE